MAGGELLAVTLVVDDEGQYVGNCKTIKQNMFDPLTFLWKKLLQEGRITEVKKNIVYVAQSKS